MLWSDIVSLWLKLNMAWQANNDGWDNPYLRLKAQDLFGERADEPFDQNGQVVLVKFTSFVIAQDSSSALVEGSSSPPSSFTCSARWNIITMKIFMIVRITIVTMIKITIMIDDDCLHELFSSSGSARWNKCATTTKHKAQHTTTKTKHLESYLNTAQPT